MCMCVCEYEVVCRFYCFVVFLNVCVPPATGGVWGRLRLHLPATHMCVLRRIGARDVVAGPFAAPGPVLGEPHLAVVGAVVVISLPGERMRLAVIGAGPGELVATGGDGGDLAVLSGGGEALQLDLIDARLLLQLLAVCDGESAECLPVVAVAVGEREDAILVLQLELVGIVGEDDARAVAVVRELVTDGIDLLVAATLMVRDMVTIGLLLLREVAMGGLVADADGLVDAGACGAEVIDMLANGADAHAMLEVRDLIDHILGGDGDLERGHHGLRGGHGLHCLCGGTSILLLFPTNHCGGFLFQFFLKKW